MAALVGPPPGWASSPRANPCCWWFAALPRGLYRLRHRRPGPHAPGGNDCHRLHRPAAGGARWPVRPSANGFPPDAGASWRRIRRRSPHRPPRCRNQDGSPWPWGAASCFAAYQISPAILQATANRPHHGSSTPPSPEPSSALALPVLRDLVRSPGRRPAHRASGIRRRNRHLLLTRAFRHARLFR